MKVNQTIFRVSKLDCFSEEQMIRMKLNDMEQVVYLKFDISDRKLIVYHIGDYNDIYKKLCDLNLDTHWEITNTDIEQEIDVKTQEKNILYFVLGVNFIFFLLEVIMGFIDNSMGLIADSLDMLADSLVYILAIIAVGKTVLYKKNITKISGYFQLGLSIFGFIEVVKRFLIVNQELPNFKTMILVSILALIGNAICLYLLQNNENREEIHMKASMIFTSNDILINLSVILSGVIVYFTQNNIPDLIIGIIVFFIVARGAIRILKLSE